jgi:hypothetical protein
VSAQSSAIRILPNPRQEARCWSQEDWQRVARADSRWLTVSVPMHQLKSKLGARVFRLWWEMRKLREHYEAPCDGGNGCLFVGRKEMTRVSGLTTNTLTRALRRLEAAGLIEVLGWRARSGRGGIRYHRRVYGEAEHANAQLVRVPLGTAQWLSRSSAYTHGGRRAGAGRKPSMVDYLNPPGPNQVVQPPRNQVVHDLINKRESTTGEIRELRSRMRGSEPPRGIEFSSESESGVSRKTIPTSPSSTVDDALEAARILGDKPLPTGAFKSGLVVRTPPPPAKLPANLDLAARQLATWAEALIAASQGGKAFWPLRALKGKTREVVARAAQALNENEIPPVDFLWWQLATWKAMQEDKSPKEKRPPPVAWLFSVKRIEKAVDVAFAPNTETFMIPPKARAYLEALKLYGLRGGPPERVNELWAMYHEARQDASLRQSQLTESVVAGKFVWR